MKEKMADHNFVKPLKEAAIYSPVISYEKVLVSVPPKLKRVIPYHPFKDRRLGLIKEYYGHGRKLRDGDSEVILNEKYFSLPTNYCGQSIVADVEIEKKIVAEGREFLQLIIYKLPDNTPAERLYKINQQAADSNSLPIPDCSLFLEFPKI